MSLKWRVLVLDPRYIFAVPNQTLIHGGPWATDLPMWEVDVSWILLHIRLKVIWSFNGKTLNNGLLNLMLHDWVHIHIICHWHFSNPKPIPLIRKPNLLLLHKFLYLGNFWSEAAVLPVVVPGLLDLGGVLRLCVSIPSRSGSTATTTR